MKILYAIQGTGNGHLSRAQEIIPHLLNYGNLDVLVSGTQSEVNLPYLIKYKHKGFGYTFGKNGGINLINSVKKLRPLNFITDIYNLPVNNYNMVINDFEPISAWACKLKGKYCFGLSHQAAYLSKKTPRTDKKDYFAEWVFKNYAPVNDKIAFHFNEYDTFIKTPVIRSLVRQQHIANQNHITVNLPAYADEILIKHICKFKDVQWHIFSKHSKLSYQTQHIKIEPINNLNFIKSLATSFGLITNAGFESPAEAMYLHKKVMVIPMLNQYEQQCNAKALKLMGITVVNKIDNQFPTHVNNWLKYACPIKISYKNNTALIMQNVFNTISKNIKVA